jgi:hypothetical protein
MILYGQDGLSLSSGKEHKRRKFENRVLRGILGLKKDEVTLGRRKLQSWEVHDLHTSQIYFEYQVEEEVVGGACSAIGGEEECA